MNDPKWFLPFCVSRTSLASFMIFDLLFYFVVLFEIVLTLYIYIYICIFFRYVNFTNAIVFQSFNCFQLRKGLSSNHREFNKVILRAVFHIVLLRCRLMHIYIYVYKQMLIYVHLDLSLVLMFCTFIFYEMCFTMYL